MPRSANTFLPKNELKYVNFTPDGFIYAYNCLLLLCKTYKFMKQIKLLCFLLIASIVIPVLAKSPKNKNKYGVYIAGVSASFSDSLVYFTDIQYVDSAMVGGDGLLVGRAQYSIQLKEYLEQQENGKTVRASFTTTKRRKTCKRKSTS